MNTCISRVLIRGNTRMGFSLVEVLIAIAISGIVLAAIVTSYSLASRGFASAGNYADLDRYTRVALDHMSRDMRQATGISAFASSDITLIVATNFTDEGKILHSKQVRYFLGANASSNILYRVEGGATSVVAKHVKFLNFVGYNRYMLTNGIQPADCKLLQVDMALEKSSYASVQNEQVLSARIVLRNKVLP